MIGNEDTKNGREKLQKEPVAGQQRVGLCDEAPGTALDLCQYATVFTFSRLHVFNRCFHAEANK